MKPLCISVDGIRERNDMPNIATVLRDEITRLARKELRNHMEGLKKASAQHRRDIAQLKRQVLKLERQVSLLERQTAKKASLAQPSPDAAPLRFTAKGLRSQRQRLGLSAADYAKLAGVTSRSIYNWEQEIARPRQEQTAVLAALRGIGKKEALARLCQLAEQRTGKKKKA
jgi:DNA-binding transcriptional regulator YiaG